jgi:hypothetical protein
MFLRKEELSCICPGDLNELGPICPRELCLLKELWFCRREGSISKPFSYIKCCHDSDIVEGWLK